MTAAGVPSVLPVLLWLFCAPALGQCRAPSAELLPVSHVIDGDTVKLQDGRRLRLIGIDTPEIGRKGAPHQPGALEARAYLQRLLRSTEWQLRLSYDEQRRDRYQRLLAHAFLPDGESVATLLLAQGLGTSLVVPPNLEFLSCYRRAVAAARQRRAGLWAVADYQLMRVHALPSAKRSYRQLIGTVEQVRTGTAAVWLYLQHGLRLRIPRQNLHYFGSLDWDRLQGRPLAMRGMLHASSSNHRLMHIRHPADLFCPDEDQEAPAEELRLPCPQAR